MMLLGLFAFWLALTSEGTAIMAALGLAASGGVLAFLRRLEPKAAPIGWPARRVLGAALAGLPAALALELPELARTLAAGRAEGVRGHVEAGTRPGEGAREGEGGALVLIGLMLRPGLLVLSRDGRGLCVLAASAASLARLGATAPDAAVAAGS